MYGWKGELGSGFYWLLPFTTGCRLKKVKKQITREVKLVYRGEDGELGLTKEFRWVIFVVQHPIIRSMLWIFFMLLIVLCYWNKFCLGVLVLWKHLQILNNSQQRNEERTDAKIVLLPSFRTALSNIFEVIDLDGNGLLSLDEYNFFELRTSGEKCDEEAWAICKGKLCYSF